MFSPLAFPTGMIIYDMATTLLPPTHLALSPFETYREPLAIIGIADSNELGSWQYSSKDGRPTSSNGTTAESYNLRRLEQQLEDMRDRFPKALTHQLLVFDHIQSEAASPLLEGMMGVPPPQQSRTTTMKTVMCDISSALLAEMTTMAKSIQAMTTIESPGQTQLSRISSGSHVWDNPSAETASRRNSQFSLPGSVSQSESPASNVNRSSSRMSMPVLGRTQTESSRVASAPRPTTPVKRSPADTPTTFDDITRSGPTSPENSAVSRSSASDKIRDSSRDRVSLQGFGSGGPSERSRNKGRGRIAVVLGSLYLHSGRWGDAIRELVDGASIAKVNNDHLWHAKALENILVSMLMFAWTGLDFQIPQICYTSADKAPSHSPSSSLSEQNGLTSNRLVSLTNLTTLLPELLEKILNLYNRAANFTGESLPQFAYSETVVRFSKLLTAVHLAGGKLNDNVLQLIVLNAPFPKQPVVHQPRLDIKPTRPEIVAILFRAHSLIATNDGLSIISRTMILSGIASVLGSLGLNRKKAMIMREIVSVLIPGLIQARKIGAAEMGVHPAAGLAALNAVGGGSSGAGALDLGEGDVESGLDGFLSNLGHIYGVVGYEFPRLKAVHGSSYENPNGNSLRVESFDDSDEGVVGRVLRNAQLREFGAHSSKLQILRACINLCEALPDFQGVLRFSADLLRTAGSGIAPSVTSGNAAASISREEQVRLAMNISRTVSAANKLGLEDLEAEYWDEFLVRNIELEPLPVARTPMPHEKKELGGTAAVAPSKAKDPFIYNPFLKRPTVAAANHLLVAGEAVVFNVTLQNPYQMDLEIESIKIETQGVEFVSTVQSTVIGPYRTQMLGISGEPKSAGTLHISGCFIKIRGCRERRFPIFIEPWSPVPENKIKAIGLLSIDKKKVRPISAESGKSKDKAQSLGPKTMAFSLTVIERQPVVVVKSTSLSQSAAMALEGERQIFSITLQNQSATTPVDFLLFSFQDSTQAPLQLAMSNKDASSAELYEYEIIFSRKQALRWRKVEGKSPFIAPGMTETYEMEVLGKPGLTSGVVQMDYAYLGKAITDVQDCFHTRQVTLPITVTVNASVELVRADILPLSGTIPKALWPHRPDGVNGDLEIAEVGYSDFCLLVLDVRNAWPSPLHVCLKVSEAGSIEEELLPGNTSRIIVPIQRLFLEDPFAAIPTLDPAKQRQFVVSTGKVTASGERASRASFWYREKLLEVISGTWSTRSGTKSTPPRHGTVDFRGIRLSPRMVDALKIDEVGIEFLVERHASRGSTHAKYDINIDEHVELKVRVTNRTTEPIDASLRLLPCLHNHRSETSYDLGKKLSWNGVLQQAIGTIPAEGHVEVCVGLTAHARGDFEIGASVEEARIIDKSSSNAVGKPQGLTRTRANTRTMMDAILGPKERRTWHAREACSLNVRDVDDDDDDDDDEP